MCVLNREVEHSSVTLEAYSHQHRLDQDKMENLGNKVRQLERMLTMRDLQLAETEQLLREMQFCTYDGVFVWKISEFLRRRQDALAGRTPAMFSPGTTGVAKRETLSKLGLELGGDRSGWIKSVGREEEVEEGQEGVRYSVGRRRRMRWSRVSKG